MFVLLTYYVWNCAWCHSQRMSPYWKSPGWLQPSWYLDHQYLLPILLFSLCWFVDPLFYIVCQTLELFLGWEIETFANELWNLDERYVNPRQFQLWTGIVPVYHHVQNQCLLQIVLLAFHLWCLQIMWFSTEFLLLL